MAAPLLDASRRTAALVPTEAFRCAQVEGMRRARTFSQPVGDPARAQRNRLERDRLAAADAARSTAGGTWKG